MTPTENWRPVPGYEGWYEVSDLGRVRSVTRVAQTVRGPWTYRGKIISQNTDSSGRKRVGLYLLGHEKNVKVHTLVLTAFVGPKPDGQEGCHNNGNPSDNRLINLRWDTHSNNELDKLTHGTHNMARKTHCKRGHALCAPNLVPRPAGRTCKACVRATDARRWAPNKGVDLQTLADTFYAEIMGDQSELVRHPRTPD